LRETIRSRPGEITLLTIGPLTNVALLFSTDPEIPALLKSLLMMCGAFTNHPPGGGQLEWNALLDPHATAIVYKHAVKIHRSVGLDVTRRVTLPAEQVRQAFQADLLRPVLDFAEIWFQERQTITFHDPLAATTLFDAQICRFERGRVRVELLDPELNGLTRWTPESDGPHEAALDVDAERFFQHFFSVFE
jgi:inosine-uridine nucleoside N-ribohydrolase